MSLSYQLAFRRIYACCYNNSFIILSMAFTPYQSIMDTFRILYGYPSPSPSLSNPGGAEYYTPCHHRTSCHGEYIVGLLFIQSTRMILDAAYQVAERGHSGFVTIPHRISSRDCSRSYDRRSSGVPNSSLQRCHSRSPRLGALHRGNVCRQICYPRHVRHVSNSARRP
jgi:hypothetical protein